MEALAQTLQNAMPPDVSVYLGAEYAESQPRLPHVVVVPSGARYGPPDGSTRDTLAQVALEVAVLCRAALFEEATLLADLCYAALPGRSPEASIRYGSEVWGDYTVRAARLTVTLPAALTRADITRVRVATFTQDARFLTLPPSEVPDDETNRPDGVTHFVESDD